MRREDFIKFWLTGVYIFIIPEFLFAKKDDDLPNVLLIGDSISVGYTPFVQELLMGKANVFRPMLDDGKPENCSGTTNGVTEIDRWIGHKKWNVIHFNFGLHDLKHVDPKTGEGSSNPNHPLQADIMQYSKNMKLIVRRLKSTGAKLIFATTTPVPNNTTNPLREPENVPKYNKAALKVMKNEKVTVNDLYSFALPKLKEIQRPDNVHFTEEGSRELAWEVAKKILQFL